MSDLVSYPFEVRRDNLRTNTLELGTAEAKASELKAFISVEEGEMPHMPDYGVKKRDILFVAGMDDAVLGVLLMRIRDKVKIWFDPGLKIESLSIKDRPTRNTVVLSLKFIYNNQEVETEVVVE